MSHIVDVDLKIKGAVGKPQLAAIPLRALIGLARVIEYGNAKYAPYNWRNAEPDSVTVERYLNATLRHLQEVQESRTFEPLVKDVESGLPHLDHAIASLVLLRDILCTTHVNDPGQGRAPATHISTLTTNLHVQR